MSGDFSLIYSMIFSDTGSGKKKTVEKNNWNAHLSSILLTNTNNSSVQDTRFPPPFRAASFFPQAFFNATVFFFLVFLSTVWLFYNPLFCDKRSPHIICIQTVRGLMTSISCGRLGGGCVILEEHPPSLHPSIPEPRMWSLGSNEHLG